VRPRGKRFRQLSDIIYERVASPETADHYEIQQPKVYSIEALHRGEISRASSAAISNTIVLSIASARPITRHVLKGAAFFPLLCQQIPSRAQSLLPFILLPFTLLPPTVFVL
jgi:hypothetical protein